MARKSEVQKERKKERERKKPNLDAGSILKDLSIPCSSPSTQILSPPPLESKPKQTKGMQRAREERISPNSSPHIHSQFSTPNAARDKERELAAD